MPDAFHYACKRLHGDETIKEAFDRVEQFLTARVMNATTPEDRDQHWRQHKALKDVLKLISIEAGKAEQQ